MTSKLLGSLIIAFFSMNISLAQVLEYEGVDFSAPLVKDKDTLVDISLGTIVYDITDGAFQALDADGTWVNIGSASELQEYVKTPGSSTNQPVIVSASGSADGTISNEYFNWVNGNCSESPAGKFTCTIETGIFSATPNCQANKTTQNSTRLCDATATSSTQFVVGCYNVTASGETYEGDTPWSVICHGYN